MLSACSIRAAWNTGDIKRATIVLCLVLAGLELVHPAFAGDAVAGAVTVIWVPLHVALVIGYALLAAVLFRTAATGLERSLLVLFALLNTAYLVVDGLVLGPYASLEPTVTLLANTTGALWCVALLALAARGRTSDRVAMGLLVLTWLTFVGAAFGLPVLVSRASAVVAMAWLAYRGGTAAIGPALLVFAAVLRQHVGPEAALGLLLLAVAMAVARSGSSPAAASQRAVE